MGKFNNLTGQKFGRLTVVERAENRYRQTIWRCLCDCGKTVEVQGKHLKDGYTTSCGCYRSECLTTRDTIHGFRREKLYEVYKSMKQRCFNPNNKHYSYYGGRGIKVCDEWVKSYLSFRKWAHENGYRDGLTIDRKDTNKDYSPDNCRWVDCETQSNNRRNVHIIRHNGTDKTLTQLAKETGISRSLLYSRLIERKWDIDRALTTPIKNQMR